MSISLPPVVMHLSAETERALTDKRGPPPCKEGGGGRPGGNFGGAAFYNNNVY